MTAKDSADAVREALERVRRDVKGGPEVNLVSLAIVEAHIAALTARVAEQTAQLAQCFKIAGADSDGNEDFRIAPHAVQAVTDLRRDYDEACNEAETLRHAALAGAEPVARVIFTNRKKPDVEWLTDTVMRDTLLFTHAPAKAREERVETGRYQFGDDWPGVFLRGDYALPMAMAIRVLLDTGTVDPFAAAQLRGLAKTLESCDARAALATFAEGE